MADGQSYKKIIFFQHSMHFIFGNINHWLVPFLLIFNYLKFKVFYLYIDADTEEKKNKIALTLKKNNICPLPIEFQKQISPKPPYSSYFIIRDCDEIAYKKNIKIMPEKILSNYSNLFSKDQKRDNKIDY